MDELDEPGREYLRRIGHRIRVRRGLTESADAATAKPEAAQSLIQVRPEMVQEKRADLEDLKRAFAKFQTGTIYLPHPMRGQISMFEGNVSFALREMDAALRGGS